MTAPVAKRMSAAERRDEILDAAVLEFAVKGLHGTSTEAIARRAGISQPYLFRLFGTKKLLFLAAVNRGFDTIMALFRLAAESQPDDPLVAMGRAYRDRLLHHREELLLQMQSYVGCEDPEVEVVVRRRFAALFTYVEQVSGAPADDVTTFMANGMLLNVAAAMNLGEVLGEESWVRRCLSDLQ